MLTFAACSKPCNQPCEQQIMERRRRKKVREREKQRRRIIQTKTSHHNCTFTDLESCTVSHYPTLICRHVFKPARKAEGKEKKKKKSIQQFCSTESNLCMSKRREENPYCNSILQCPRGQSSRSKRGAKASISSCSQCMLEAFPLC